MITAQQLATATGATPARATLWLAAISAAMAACHISTQERQAAFLAQIGHESGGLQWVRELWGPTPAQRGYEGRADLGNTHPGDGFRFRGRGLIQITGRANYRAMGDALLLDLEQSPELLEQPANAAMSAAQFWASHGLNQLADEHDMMHITRKINGGTNGLPERMALYTQATEALA